MKKVIGLFFVLAIIVAAQGVAAQVTYHKYDIKSGIVTMESVMSMGTTEIMKLKFVVYFDDYGMKECRETYKDGKLNGAYFSDGKTRYDLKLEKKIAFNKGKAYNGTELRVDYSEMGSQKDRDSGKIKKIAPMMVADKQCEAIEAITGSSDITQYAGWKKVMVYMKSKSASMTTIIKATKIEENVAVPAAKFQVPAGYTIQ